MSARQSGGWRKTLRFVDEKFEEIIGVTVLAVVVTLIFAGVALRLTFKSGMPWQEELSRILYVLVVYLGASFGVRSKDHIRVTFLVNALPRRARHVLRIVTDIIWAGFNVIIVILSLQVYRTMQRFLGTSAVLRIPLHYIFLIIPFGFALLTLRLIQSYFRGKPWEDEEALPPDAVEGPGAPGMDGAPRTDAGTEGGHRPGGGDGEDSGADDGAHRPERS